MKTKNRNEVWGMLEAVMGFIALSSSMFLPYFCNKTVINPVYFPHEIPRQIIKDEGLDRIVYGAKSLSGEKETKDYQQRIKDERLNRMTFR